MIRVEGLRKLTVLVILLLNSVFQYGQIVADHTVVDQFDQIPQQYKDEVKKMWLVLAGESHSAAYRDGLLALEAIDPSFAVGVIESGVPEAYTSSYLRTSRATWGDVDNESGWIYGYGEEDWCCFTNYPAYSYNPAAVARTKAGISYCNSNNLPISAFGFGWCYDDGYELVNSYITATKEHVQYCKENNDTKVFFTTGPMDDYIGEGEAGYENSRRWATIRDTVGNDPTRVLFDYADILSFNDSGEQETETWNEYTYPTMHPDNIEGAYTGHIGEVGALRLAKAMWWMLARMAGWDESAPNIRVTSVEVNSEGGVNEINTGENLQFSAVVSPVDATNKSISWSVTNGTGTATITQAGLLTALSPGTIDVVATAIDGMGVSDQFGLMILSRVAGTGIDLYNKVSIYPNPGTGLFYLDAGPIPIELVEVVNPHGSILLEKIPDPREPIIQLELSGHASGLYFIKLYSGNSFFVKHAILNR